jgi:hypothetical protein
VDARLVRVSKICLALPETTRQIYGQHACFRVRKRPFAWFLHDHHGDGIVALSAKVLSGDNQALAAAHPERFLLPAYTASRGWVSLRLDTRKVDWEEVADLAEGSYCLVAPKRLAEIVAR